MPKYPITESFWIDEDQRIKAILTPQSPVWYARYNLPGIGQKKQSLKTTSKKQARLNGYAFARRLTAGEITGRKLTRVTLETAIDAKLDWLKNHGRDPMTLEIYGRFFGQLKVWAAGHGVRHLDQLTVAALEEFERTLRETGIALPPRPQSQRGGRKSRPLMKKTVRDAMKTIKGLLKFAKQRHMIERDPSDGYELPPGPSAEIEIFTPAELGMIFAEPEASRADIWRFLTMTCLRANEFCWLTKADVSLDGAGHPAAIVIRRKKCPITGVAWKPKHGIERFVPLAAEAADILARSMGATKGPWAFEAPDTQSPQAGKWQRQRLLRKLKSRLQACGIGHGHLHIFRHTGATYLANDPRMSIPQLQKFLGHTDVRTTMRYMHPQAQDVAESLQRVDFSRLAEPAGGEVAGTGMIPGAGKIPGGAAAADSAGKPKPRPERRHDTDSQDRKFIGPPALRRQRKAG